MRSEYSRNPVIPAAHGNPPVRQAPDKHGECKSDHHKIYAPCPEGEQAEKGGREGADQNGDDGRSQVSHVIFDHTYGYRVGRDPEIDCVTQRGVLHVP